MKTALIKRCAKGKVVGQFRFVLRGSNNKVIAVSGTETYHNKKDLLETLKNNFSDFVVKDLTNNKIEM